MIVNNKRIIKPDVFRDPEEVPVEVRKVIDDCRQGVIWPLVLYGPVGVGKTLATLVEADKAYWPRHETLRAFVSERILAQRKMWFDDSGYLRNEKEWLDRIKKHDLLIIDEVGSNPEPSVFERDTLHDILSLREQMPLMVISNRNPEEILSLYGDPIMSRLSRGKFYRFSGGDRRLSKYKDSQNSSGKTSERVGKTF